jgi:hypothetical protein
MLLKYLLALSFRTYSSKRTNACHLEQFSWTLSMNEKAYSGNCMSTQEISHQIQLVDHIFSKETKASELKSPQKMQMVNTAQNNEMKMRYWIQQHKKEKW